MESPDVLYTVYYLPPEILHEILQELDTLTQIKLSRVSSEWKAALSNPRLRKSCFLDIKLFHGTLHNSLLTPFWYRLAFCTGQATRAIALNRERIEDLLYNCISERTKILHVKLDVDRPDHVPEQIWSDFCLHFIWHLLRIGKNITHFLLEDAWVDGSVELWKYFMVPGRLPARFDGTATPHSLRVVSFKNGLFSTQRRFFPTLVWFPNGRCATYGGKPVNDCVYDKLPDGCSPYTKIPLLTFDLRNPSQAEQDMVLSLDCHSEEVPPGVLQTLTDKVRNLPEDARTRWKAELHLNEPQYRGVEAKEIDLNSVNWSTLRKTTQHFFLCFKAVYDPQVHHYDPFHGYV
ncbi:hypothetical protein RvY_01204 [Ramazzottius varieornatus]|uniref:F-box domain-containing protein n=1 Tax=Ramazzottius varieornatus TaxID=947166 RepID=A0A1D1UQU4_RAMVA|nr:hypothetical protein RvY_01204 [Ramazzottius varieornatus]